MANMTAKQRAKATSIRMKKYWANVRKNGGRKTVSKVAAPANGVIRVVPNYKVAHVVVQTRDVLVTRSGGKLKEWRSV